MRRNQQNKKEGDRLIAMLIKKDAATQVPKKLNR